MRVANDRDRGQGGADAQGKLYGHARGLDRLEPHYSRHVSAMTSEGLHSKSDIAAELAWRDKEIARLAALVEHDFALVRAMYDADEGQASVELRGAPLVEFAAIARNMLGTAENYVEMQMVDDLGGLTLRVQRHDGKTAHALRLEAESERDEARRRAERLREPHLRGGTPVRWCSICSCDWPAGEDERHDADCIARPWAGAQ